MLEEKLAITYMTEEGLPLSFVSNILELWQVEIYDFVSLVFWRTKNERISYQENDCFNFHELRSKSLNEYFRSCNTLWIAIAQNNRMLFDKTRKRFIYWNNFVMPASSLLDVVTSDRVEIKTVSHTSSDGKAK